MAGLCVLLEKQHAAAATTTTAAVRSAQIISKTTVVLSTTTPSSAAGKIHGYSSSTRAPVATAMAASSSSFLQRCFLCYRMLADGDDIYIYRHILTEDVDDDMNCCAEDSTAAATRGRSVADAGGFFAY
uniref:FLZ-type domain-containing protein n=1 Tax=Leersia perrieri TaxID=77586 RepID=A0A0D9XUZ4_9ORYZ